MIMAARVCVMVNDSEASVCLPRPSVPVQSYQPFGGCKLAVNELELDRDACHRSFLSPKSTGMRRIDCAACA